MKQSLAKVRSGAVTGVDAFPVEIEVDAGQGGDPVIVVVGLPDAAVRESRDRVAAAMVNAGFAPYSGRVTVNLAPADVRKEGPLFDLPIAVGILAAQGDIVPEPGMLESTALVGELSLSGEVRRVRGVLPIALEMRRQGLHRILVPPENAAEAAAVDGIDVFAVRTLRDATDLLEGAGGAVPVPPPAEDLAALVSADEPDFAEVRGQESAKRAVTVAVAGGHNLLMIGPPGSGKSMIARRIASILPPMTLDEALDATKIHSIAGLLPADQPLLRQRPFRAPHHTVSDAGLLGGGSNPMPGEVSLAHHGVLFLDELPEFHRQVLEVLRQPLEDGVVTITRAAATCTFPCQMMLVAAMNPCPCGFHGDPKHQCRCSHVQIQNYRNKISGPLLDRIDLHIEVAATRFQDLQSRRPGLTSAQMREAVENARLVQRRRFADLPRIHSNARMGRREIERFCRLDEASATLLRIAMEELNFSARGHDRILKVARTVADLEGHENIAEEDIQEALQYRALDRQFWF